MANPTFAAEEGSPGDERLAATTLAFVGVAILIFLGIAGGRYYMLPDMLRYRSPQHALMKPSGSWGHGIGILATGVMLLNFVYSAPQAGAVAEAKGLDRALAALPRVRGDPDAAGDPVSLGVSLGESARHGDLRLAGGRGRDRPGRAGSSMASSASTPRRASGRRRCAPDCSRCWPRSARCRAWRGTSTVRARWRSCQRWPRRPGRCPRR